MSLHRAEEKVTIHFLNRDGKRITVKALTGDSLLDVVVNHDLDIDGFGKLLKNFVDNIKTQDIISRCISLTPCFNPLV